MRQFDVYANPSPPSRSFAPYVILLQSHHIALDTVIIAPLINDTGNPVPIDLGVEFKGERLVIAITELGSVDRKLLRRRVGELRDQEDGIRRALNRLFTGF